MKRLMYFVALGVAIAATMGTLPACDDEDNPTNTAPTTGSASGTVTFQGTWPSTGDVQVSIFSAWPPMGPPDASTDPITPGTTYEYRFDGLDPATYPAIVVGWRLPSNPASQKIIGMFWADEDSVAVDSNGNPLVSPESVTVEAGNSKGSLDMVADLDVAP